jgi:competence protein ComEA
VRSRLGSVLAATAGLVVLLTIGWWLLRPPAAPVEAALPLATSAADADPSGAASGASSAAAPSGGGEPAASTTTTAPDVVVQAAGAVRKPGLYRVPAGARVDDLIRAAGGLSESADRDRVNLAAAVHDGERVWIPGRGEGEPPPVVAGTGSSPGGSAASGATGSEADAPSAGPVDLNAADAAALDELPGVGPATAAAILAHREQEGPFRSVDDLLEVRGIGEAKLEQLRPLVSV